MTEDLFKSAALPDGEYAIVELLGHRTLVGRISEVERFGGKFIHIEPVFAGRLLGPVLHGAAAIYGLTAITREQAAARGPTELYQLPVTLRDQVPVEALPPPVTWDDVGPYTADDSLDGDDDGND